MLEEMASDGSGETRARRFFVSLVRGMRGGHDRMGMEFSGGDERPEALLKASEDLYREVALELVAATERLRQGELGEVKAAVQAAKDLRVAFQLVMEERTRVDKLRKQVAGAAGGAGELDFAAARTEIGRRLARLRAAGAGG